MCFEILISCSDATAWHEAGAALVKCFLATLLFQITTCW